jgi:hypothetical protein
MAGGAATMAARATTAASWWSSNMRFCNRRSSNHGSRASNFVAARSSPMTGFRSCAELAATEDFANCDGGFHGRAELARDDGGFRGRVELASDGGRRSTNDGGGRL